MLSARDAHLNDGLQGWWMGYEGWGRKDGGQRVGYEGWGMQSGIGRRCSRDDRDEPRLHFGRISATPSRVHLEYISSTSRVHLGYTISATPSRLHHLNYISATPSRLHHLNYISAACRNSSRWMMPSPLSSHSASSSAGFFFSTLSLSCGTHARQVTRRVMRHVTRQVARRGGVRG